MNTKDALAAAIAARREELEAQVIQQLAKDPAALAAWNKLDRPIALLP
jgi:hypothetical protein